MSRSRKEREREEARARLRNSVGAEETGIRARVFRPSAEPAQAPDAPAKDAPPATDAAPAKQAPEAKKRTGARQRAAAASIAAPALDALLAKEAGYTAVSNVLLDEILKRLTPVEQSVYLRLYRLSHGFKSATCTVGIPALVQACNASERAVRYALRELEDKRLVELVGASFAGPLDKRGNTFRVAAPPLPERSAKDAPPATDAAGARDAHNKKTLKNMDQKAPGARAPAGSLYEIRTRAARIYEARHRDPSFNAATLRTELLAELGQDSLTVDDATLNDALEPVVKAAGW